MKVHLGTGEVELVAFPVKRRKWAMLASTFSGLQWAIVEGIDKDGMMVGRYEHPDILDHGLVDIGIGGEAQPNLEGNLALMLKAQDIAVHRLGDYHIALMDKMTAVIDILAQRLSESEARTGDAWNAVHAAVTAAGSAESPDEATEIIRALPALAQVFGGNGVKPPTQRPPTPAKPRK